MILPLLLALQTTPVAPIVKGTALPPPGSASSLPPPGSEEAQVMAPITALLGALDKHDPAAILAVTLPEGSVTAAQPLPDGTRRHKTVRWAEFAAGLKPDGIRLVETLGTPAVEIDEDVAMVWAPYRFTIDGKFSHCGYDHFDLVRTAAGWKILNLTYSRRTTGCAE